jgi:hypothetical protein
MPPPIRQGYGLNDLSPAFARTLRASLATDLLEQIGFAEKPSPTGRQRCSGRERHACGHATNGRRSTAPRGVGKTGALDRVAEDDLRSPARSSCSVRERLMTRQAAGNTSAKQPTPTRQLRHSQHDCRRKRSGASVAPPRRSVVQRYVWAAACRGSWRRS